MFDSSAMGAKCDTLGSLLIGAGGLFLKDLLRDLPVLSQLPREAANTRT
jgi:hypothetical protein